MISEGNEISSSLEFEIVAFQYKSYFDYGLNSTLISILDNDFNMNSLNNVGLVLGERLSGLRVVTFVNSEYDADITTVMDEQTKRMAYAYILFHEGVPSVSFNDFCQILLPFPSDRLVKEDVSLKLTEQGEELQALIEVRKTYIEGETDILTVDGRAIASIQNDRAK